MSETPRYKHKPITMRHVVDTTLNKVGDFKWEVGNTGNRTLVLLIPKGKDSWCYSRWSIGYKNHCGASWSWDGNEDTPTLQPSLHAVGVWHGWVKEGKLIEA